MTEEKNRLYARSVFYFAGKLYKLLNYSGKLLSKKFSLNKVNILQQVNKRLFSVFLVFKNGLNLCHSLQEQFQDDSMVPYKFITLWFSCDPPIATRKRNKHLAIKDAKRYGDSMSSQ